MKTIVFLVVFLISLSSSAIGQSTDEEAKELFSTYGYCHGQETSLDQISKTFPELSPNVRIARLNFSVFFGKTCDHVKSLIPEDIQIALTNQVESQIEMYRAKNETEALNFIKLVQERSDG